MNAAQYVRMSKEQQQYSIANQTAAIQMYARNNGFEIVRTYSDEAKSGLSLEWRPELRRLLEDVIRGGCGFSAVLVYDVSRWGRFQDVDESACYEFVCKSAGIRVHYCVEAFSNDDSIASGLLKALKRSMAGEYSRELSGKVFAAQCRLARMGYKLGGKPGFGFRRLLLDTNGKPLVMLADRQWKYLASQHVKLVLGPEEELATVRLIYSLYLDEDMSPAQIVRILNEKKVSRSADGSSWNISNLCKILTDPKYAGYGVFARTSSKLRSKPKCNPRQNWVVQPDCVEPIVPLDLFQRAQKKRENKVQFRTDDQLLEDLRRYIEANGSVSTSEMNPGHGLPSHATYSKRFGSVTAAYDRIGYQPRQVIFWQQEAKRSRLFRKSLELSFKSAFAVAGIPLRQLGPVFSVRGCRRFTFEVARCVERVSGGPRWQIYCRRGSHKHACAVARLNPDNRTVKDWFLLMQVPKFKEHFSLSGQQIAETDSIRESPEQLIQVILTRCAGMRNCL